MRQIVHLPKRLPARSRVFPPSPRNDLLSMDVGIARIWRSVLARARGASGTAPRPEDRSAGSAPRHRPLGAGHVRGGIFPSARTVATALPARRSRPRRRLRHEFGRQRQRSGEQRLFDASTCNRRPATPGGAIGAAFACGTSLAARVPSSWITPIGARSFHRDEIAPLLAASANPRSTRPAASVEEISDEAELCRRTAAAIADGQGRWLVPRANGVGPARARQPLDRVRSAPRRHEGDPQCQDQAARIVPAIRAIGA